MKIDKLKNSHLIMNISIKVVSKGPEKINGLDAVRGEIAINDFKEEFVASFGRWSLEDYERQWKEGLERIYAHDRSCLVTLAQDVNVEPLVILWALYKIKNKIHVQNYLYVEEGYERRIGDNEFTPETCYDFIDERKTHTKSGWKISEWVVDFDEEQHI